ncbi:hypothetical protein [Humitalea rosea]|uniref:hypothetical protein n=1 Tax=Humitalea rosea TaxID=990373 RepID=UPI0011B8049B|nr:hypothetical protein [Humitalea rosea]
MAIVVAKYSDYLRRCSPSADEDPKAFTAWHAGGRAALAHLEHLLKLLKPTGGAAEAVAAGEDLLAQASSDMGPPDDEE